MSLTNFQPYIEKALSTYGGQLSSDEKAEVSSYLNNLISFSAFAEKYSQLKLLNDYAACCTYIKISPVKVEPQQTFGSHIKSEYLNEISICGAKIEDGLFTPDENNILLKALITEQSLSEAVFSTGNFQGKPITYTSFNGCAVDKYKPSISLAQQYQKKSIERKNEFKIAIENALSEATKLQDPIIKLNKSNKAELTTLVERLLYLLEHDINYTLENIRDNLENEFKHINSEVISSVTGYLKNIAKPAIGLPGSLEKSKTETFFDLFTDGEKYSGVSKILKLLLDDEPEQKERKKIDSVLNSFISNSKKNLHPSKGMINIKQRSGSPLFVFGESRNIQNFINLEFSFGHDSIGDSGELEINTAGRYGSIAQVSLTNSQFMELLQTSLNDNWVQCTLSRYLFQEIEGRSNLNHQHDPYHQEEIELPESMLSAKNSILSLLDLLAGSSVSKSTRIALLEKLEQASTDISKGLFDEDVVLNEASENLLSAFKQQNSDKIYKLLSAVGENNKLPSGLLNHISFDSSLKLENKE